MVPLWKKYQFLILRMSWETQDIFLPAMHQTAVVYRSRIVTTLQHDQKQDQYTSLDEGNQIQGMAQCSKRKITIT